MKTHAPNVPTDRGPQYPDRPLSGAPGLLILGLWYSGSSPSRQDPPLPLLPGGGFILSGLLLLIRGLPRRRVGRS